MFEHQNRSVGGSEFKFTILVRHSRNKQREETSSSAPVLPYHSFRTSEEITFIFLGLSTNYSPDYVLKYRKYETVFLEIVLINASAIVQ